NITVAKTYNYGNLTTPARTYNFTYLTDPNYMSRYIRNRVLTVTVTPAGGSTINLVGNSYDTTTCGPLDATFGGPELLYHEPAYGTSFTYRGNVTVASTLADTTCTAYKITGVPYKKQDGAGRQTAIATS